MSSSFRPPGTVALSDAQTLRAMGKTLLVGGQRAVDPPSVEAILLVVANSDAPPYFVNEEVEV